jgi:hypothetical protein
MSDDKRIISVDINEGCLEYMLKLGMILDYTDDGLVFRKDAGWVSAGDVVEFYLGMEDYYREEWKREETEV